jgi:hypothetical protein
MMDIKDVFTAVLDVPPPPLAPSADVIRAARRAARRAHAARLALATAAIVAGAGALLGADLGGGAASSPPTYMWANAGPPSAAVVESLPRDVALVTEASMDERSGPGGGPEIFGVIAAVRRGGEYGQVRAYWQQRPDSTQPDDPCATASVMLSPGEEVKCITISVGGALVQLGQFHATTPRGEPIVVPFAARDTPSGIVIVVELPYNKDYLDDPKPMLSAAIYSPTELAALAADPRLVP